MALTVKPSCSVVVSAPDTSLIVVPGCAAVPFQNTAGLFWWPLEEESGDRVDAVNGVALVPEYEGEGLVTQDDAKVAKGLHFVANVNQHVILQSVRTAGLAYAGGGIDAMFWLKVNSYGASSQILIPRLRFYDIDETFLSAFTFNAFSASIAKLICSNILDANELNSPLIPPLGEWHFYRVFFDESDGKIGIQVDNGSVVKSTYAFVDPMPNAALAEAGIWHSGSGGGSLDDFLVDELVIRLGGLFSAAAVEAYYNSGAGRTFP